MLFLKLKMYLISNYFNFIKRYRRHNLLRGRVPTKVIVAISVVPRRGAPSALITSHTEPKPKQARGQGRTRGPQLQTGSSQ